MMWCSLDDLYHGQRVTTTLRPDASARWVVLDLRRVGPVTVARLQHLDEPWTEKHVLVTDDAMPGSSAA